VKLPDAAAPAALAVAVLVAVAWPIALSALSLLHSTDDKPPTLPSAGNNPAANAPQAPPAPSPAVPAAEQNESPTSAESEHQPP